MPAGLYPQRVAFKLPLRDGHHDEAPPDGLWVVHDLRTQETKTQKTRPRGAQRTISGKRTPHRSYVVLEEGPQPTERKAFVLGAMIYTVDRTGIGLRPLSRGPKRARSRVRVARPSVGNLSVANPLTDHEEPKMPAGERPLRQKDLDRMPTR